MRNYELHVFLGTVLAFTDPITRETTRSVSDSFFTFRLSSAGDTIWSDFTLDADEGSPTPEEFIDAIPMAIYDHIPDGTEVTVTNGVLGRPWFIFFKSGPAAQAGTISVVAEPCRRCHAVYRMGGDGFDGLCPDCADKAERTT